MNPPRLDTGRLSIQPIATSDANSLYAYRSHPDVTRFQSKMFTNELEALDFIRNHEGHGFGIPNTWFQLGIYLKPDMALIGDIGLHFLDQNTKTVEIGYTIAPTHQRKGYAFEAVSRMLAYLFTILHTNIIIAVTDPQNHPSIGLLARLGFEKTAPESIPIDLELLPEDMVFTFSKVV